MVLGCIKKMKTTNNPIEIKKSRHPELSEKENFALDVFLNNHVCDFFKDKDIPTGVITRLLKQNIKVGRSVTEIGSKAIIYCDICKEEWDITDYEEW